MTQEPFKPDQVISGPLFNEPMRIETVRSNGADTWSLGVVGVRSEQYRKVTLAAADLATLTITESVPTYRGGAKLIRLGLQAYCLGIASLRATTATLLLDAGVDIVKVKGASRASARDDDSDLRQAKADGF